MATPERDRARVHLLIINDNPMGRRFLRAAFAGTEFHLEECGDGLEALRLLEAGGFSAVVTDVLMPGMDGYRLCLSIRRSDRLRGLAIVMYTAAYTSTADERLARDVGVDAFLTKPAAPGEIVASVRKALQAPARAVPSKSAEELAVLKEYSELLVGKLIEKNRELQAAHDELEKRVAERTAELHAFTHAVSHDLRGPLRRIGGFAEILAARAAPKLDAEEKQLLKHLGEGSVAAMALVEALMRLSRINQTELEPATVDLSALLRAIGEGLRASEPGRAAEIRVQDGMTVRADAKLLAIALQNLFENAWKFTSRTPKTVIEAGRSGDRFFIRDNGAGFDPAYAETLFQPFRRLHAASEFPGTGLGLATVRRILEKHGGTLEVEGAINQGATAYFTLPS